MKGTYYVFKFQKNMPPCSKTISSCTQTNNYPYPGVNALEATTIIPVNKPVYFVDAWRKGLYILWHHQHFFKEIKDGIEMTDGIHYATPFGVTGCRAHRLFVKKQLNAIFDYRRRILTSLFQESNTSDTKIKTTP